MPVVKEATNSPPPPSDRPKSTTPPSPPPDKPKNTTTPSPSPSPSPKATTPSPFSWDELNRLSEVYKFWRNVMLPELYRLNIPEVIIQSFAMELVQHTLDIIHTKIMEEQPRGLSLERAIDIIAQELPALLGKQESISAEQFQNIINFMRNLMNVLKRG